MPKPFSRSTVSHFDITSHSYNQQLVFDLESKRFAYYYYYNTLHLGSSQCSSSFSIGSSLNKANPDWLTSRHPISWFKVTINSSTVVEPSNPTTFMHKYEIASGLPSITNAQCGRMYYLVCSIEKMDWDGVWQRVVVGIFQQNRENLHTRWFGFTRSHLQGSFQSPLAIRGVLAHFALGVGVASQVDSQVPQQLVIARSKERHGQRQ